jgi:hypothetical protein
VVVEVHADDDSEEPADFWHRNATIKGSAATCRGHDPCNRAGASAGETAVSSGRLAANNRPSGRSCGKHHPYLDLHPVAQPADRPRATKDAYDPARPCLAGLLVSGGDGHHQPLAAGTSRASHTVCPPQFGSSAQWPRISYPWARSRSAYSLVAKLAW